MGTMDISVDVEDTGRAKEVIQAILEELHIDTRMVSVEVEECDETPYAAVYKPGDCLAMKLPDGDYGAVLVLAADDNEPDGRNLVGILNYKRPDKPTLAVFEQREWLILSHHAWRNQPEIRWCWAITYPKYAELFEHVGRVELQPDDPKESNTYGGWNGLDVEVVSQHRWDLGERW